MKTIKIMSALALCLLTLTTATSCSSKKTTVDAAETLDGANLVAKSKSQTMAENKPMTRAWGVGTAPDQAFAKSIAEMEARRQYASSIGTIVKGAIEVSNDKVNKAATDGKKTTIVGDFGQITDQNVKNIIDNIAVSGTVVVNTDTYKTKNGEYLVYVCIEYLGDYIDLEQDLINQYRSTIEQQVSGDERAQLEEHIDKFKKSIEDDFTRRSRAAKIGED